MIDDPVLYWPADEPAGTLVEDVAGNRDGTVVGGAGRAAGKIDGGLSLDGIDDAIDFAALDLGVAHTAAAWLRFRDPGDGIVLAGTIGNYALYHDGTDFYYSATAGNFASTPHGLALPDLAWHHYAVTRQAGRVRFYLDGAQRGADQALGDPAPALALSRVGAYPHATFFATVDVDEVRMYSRELTAGDVAELYAWRPVPDVTRHRAGHRTGAIAGAAAPRAGHRSTLSPGTVALLP